MRIAFWLTYLANAELGGVIQVSTNKSEAFNTFIGWLLFGGESIIAENDRDEQRKIIK